MGVTVDEIEANTNITELEEIIEYVREEIVEDIEYVKSQGDNLILIGEENKNKNNEIKDKLYDVKVTVDENRAKLHEVKTIGEELKVIEDENKAKLHEIKDKL